MSGIVNVTITVPDTELAEQLARDLVESRLAASCNISDGVRSIYRWQGAIHTAPEAVISLRTQHKHIAAIVEATKVRHPYETPHIVAVPIVGANPDYEKWVVEATSGIGQ